MIQKSFFLNLKRQFLFKEEHTKLWEKCPRLVAFLSKVSKRSGLSFKDAGILKEPMDWKAEEYFKESMEACSAKF